MLRKNGVQKPLINGANRKALRVGRTDTYYFMKKLLPILAIIFLSATNAFSQWDGTWPKQNTYATYSGGTGTSGSPYILATLNDFLLFAVNSTNGPDGYSSNKHFSLTTDIDLNNISWNPIGAISGGKYRFKGYFNGNGHKISNLYIYASAHDNVGLFKILWGGSIKNVVVENANITCNGYAGCIVGSSESSTIMNCYASGNITSEYSAGNCIGGIVGDMKAAGAYSTAYSYVVNCYASVNVRGNYFIGGLIGNCINSTVLNCQSVGNVEGNKNVGGLTGTFNSSVMNNCFSSGKVTAAAGNCGGLIGSNIGTVNNSYWDIQASGQTKATGNEKSKSAIGKTTAELKAADFVTTLNTAKGTITGFPSDISLTTWFQDNQQTPINKGYPIFEGQTLRSTAGIKVNNKLLAFDVYPNPANDMINIIIDTDSKALPYVIFDRTGKQIISANIKNGINSIDVSSLASGLYLIRIGDRNMKNFKLVKN